LEEKREKLKNNPADKGESIWIEAFLYSSDYNE
jgi:hypothetical protein